MNHFYLSSLIISPIYPLSDNGGVCTTRKRYSWNPSMFRGLEHPSAFPSMLRGSTPEPRPLVRRDSYGSSHQLRRESNGASSPAPTSLSTILNRRDSGASTHLSRRDSNGSVLSRKDSSDFKPSTKRDSFNDDFRRLSFGTSIYLRPDSTGATNLIRRDSFGRRDPITIQRNPRDYVSKLFEYKTNSTINGNGYTPTDKIINANSILRKPDDAHTNKENLNSDLTTANLTKHVTIWEKDDDKLSNNHNHNNNETTSGRRDSSGSLSNYLASRRISVDSLDVRQNSRRGSCASGDINLSKINDEPDEVNALYKYTYSDEKN